jgi:putative ABC transport system ATP-binding protein
VPFRLCSTLGGGTIAGAEKAGIIASIVAAFVGGRDIVFAAEALRIAVGDRGVLTLSFRLDPGRALRLAGPSGAGKTTVLRALARLDDSAAGTVTLDGTSVTALAAPRWRRLVAYLPQKPVVLPGTVEDNLRAPFRTRNAAGEPYNPETARALCAELGLNGDFLSRDAALASGGEAARVALARALLTSPRVLLADEPTAHLDPAAETAVERLLVRFLDRGGMLIFVAHEKKHSLDIPCDVIELDLPATHNAAPAPGVSPEDRPA